MAKVLEATCVAGVVKVDGIVVAGAQILSEGVAASSGIVVIDLDRIYYVAMTTPDVKTTLEKMLAALGEVRQALTAIATGPVTATQGAAGPTWPALKSSLETRASALETLESEVATLKDGLK